MMRLLTSCLGLALLAASTAGAQVTTPRSTGSQLQGTSPPRVDAGAPSDYIVGAQDIIKIMVFEEPSMSGIYRVDNDGSIQYPILGRIPAAGMTLRDIEQTLKTKLEDGYINRAQVAVDVEQFRSRSVFIVGEVRTPGKYPMTGQMTLIEALAAAGSTTQNASTELLILRPRDPGSARPLTPDQSDRANVTHVSLADLQLGRLSENVSLKEGDTIFVPKAEKFFITGQVKSPGAFTYERGLTVLQAMSLAGGLTDKGSNRRLKVIRVVNGKKAELKIDLTDPVQPGDTLVIPQRLL